MKIIHKIFFEEFKKKQKSDKLCIWQIFNRPNILIDQFLIDQYFTRPKKTLDKIFKKK